MPSYTIEIPGKGSYTVDSQTDLTDYQAYRAVQKQIAADDIALQQHQAKTGFIPAVKAGARQFVAGAEEALGFKEAAEEQRQKAAATFEPTTEEDIALAKEKGIFPTAGAYLSQKVTEPLGGIVGRFGAPTVAGIVAPEAAIAGIGARALAFGATDLPASIGESMEAQRAAGQEVDPTKAIAAGLAKTTIATIGMPGVGRISQALGPKVLAEAEALAPRVAAGVITKEAALAQLSGRAKTYAQSMLANTVAGTGMMLGTEAVERFQTGQPQMTGKEALETAEQAAILSPFFAAFHRSGRTEALNKLSDAQKARELEVQKIYEDRYKLASLDEKAKIQRDLADLDLQQKIRERIYADTNKPVQEIINEITGVTKPEGIKTKQADIEAALNEPSGQFVIDPITQQERQLTIGELQKIQRPELFPEEPANVVSAETLTDLGIKKSTPLVKKGGLEGLDLNKPEEAQQFIEGLTLFKEQKGVDPTTKLRIETKIKEVEDNLKALETKQKEAQDERLKSTTDRDDISVSGEPMAGRAEGVSEPVGVRGAEPTADLRPTEMGEARRGAPLEPEATEVIKAEKEQIKSDEPKLAVDAMPAIRETPETIISALKERFGNNVNKAMERGDVKLIESKDLPANIAPDAVAYFDKGAAHLITDRLSREEAPRKLLHEVGVHFGLEGMAGKNLYRDILRTVSRLKDTDAAVKAATEHVNNRYKELTPGSREHAEEVLARLGESAPNHNLWRRIVSAIKEFLLKKGLWNPNRMDVRDIQDLINRSTAKSLAGKIKPSTRVENFKNWFGKSKIVDGEGAPLRLYHGTSENFDVFKHPSETKGPKGGFIDTQGFYFTADPGVAEVYADHFGRNLKLGPKGYIRKAANQTIVPVYLRIENPFVVDMKKPFDHPSHQAIKQGRIDYEVMANLKSKGYDGVILKTTNGGNEYVAFDANQIKSATGNLGTFDINRPEIQYAKAELPISERFNETKVFSPPGENQERSFKEFATGTYDQFKSEEGRKNIVDSASRAFLEGRTKVAYAGAGVQSKLIKDFNGSVNDALGNVRADILYDQALNGNILGSVSAKEGRIIFDENGVAKVEPSQYHISAVFDELGTLSKKIGAADAKHVASAYLQALRYKDILENNAKYEALIKRTENQKLKDQYKKEIKFVSDEQRAAIEPSLKYANEFPEVKKMAEIYDRVNRDEIDMLEKAGIYSKEYADKLRGTKGYVPLFRVMEELDNATPGAKQYFKGLVDLGKQHAFEGSERQTLDVLDNMLTRHMWAVNAAVRNNANKQLVKQLAVHDEAGQPIYHFQVPADKADVMTPIFVDGKRKFVEYTDPLFARAVHGIEPSLGPILGLMGKASNALRIGVTATPTFQIYQLFNDAPRAAMLSGVNRPFKLMGEVFKSFYTTLKDPNDPIIKEMNRLGISGGFGHTAKDIADKMRRDLGIEANTLGKRALDKTEQFAAASDMAQRRAVFKRTLLETGGLENADGSITGGNKVLAMDRAMNIIHWQKRGTSNKVRVLTQVVPFLNAYIQGMDTLIRAMRGEGISGREKKEAQILFAQTALKIAALSTVYAMAVGGDEEYQKLDDRQKIRSFIIPGTGFKVPVASEVAMLTKAIPEMTWQYINREGTENPMDSTKLMQAIGQSFADGLLGPNLMPQALRAGVEVVTNHDFLTGNPIVGRGLENLATSEQFTENTSQLAKLVGGTGIISPVNLDHLIKGYGGTMAAGVLYATDATANMFFNDKLPTTPLYRVPMIGSFMYNPEGKGQLNDYYDLKNRSDEVTATLNHLRKFGTPEEAQEYATDKKEILAIRGRVNAISNQMKILREQRKRIIASNLSSDEKRSQLNIIDARINNMVQNIGALRVKAGL
jgi:hypothetical protein